MNDFATAFLTLRGRMLQAWQQDLKIEQNTTVCGQPTALHCWFDNVKEIMLFGMMQTGETSHSHERRLLVTAPVLDEAAWAHWWQYAQQLQDTLVDASEGHGFTYISLIIACGQVDKSVEKGLRKCNRDIVYEGDQHGTSTLRLCIVDLSRKKCFCNRMGGTLGDMIKPLLR